MPTWLRRAMSGKEVERAVGVHVRDLCGSVGKFEELLKSGDEAEATRLFLEVVYRIWQGDGEAMTKQVVEFYIGKVDDIRKERLASALAVKWLGG
jgi:hypothetical protein